jgi:hypothetical protein
MKLLTTTSDLVSALEEYLGEEGFIVDRKYNVLTIREFNPYAVISFGDGVLQVSPYPPYLPNQFREIALADPESIDKLCNYLTALRLNLPVR